MEGCASCRLRRPSAWHPMRPVSAPLSGQLCIFISEASEPQIPTGSVHPTGPALISPRITAIRYPKDTRTCFWHAECLCNRINMILNLGVHSNFIMRLKIRRLCRHGTTPHCPAEFAASLLWHARQMSGSFGAPSRGRELAGCCTIG